jgi:hypothetical protein
MKPGYKTTEFWVTAAVCVGAFTVVGFREAGDTWTNVTALVIAFLAALGYTSNRSEVKRIEAAKQALASTTPAAEVAKPVALRAWRPSPTHDDDDAA